MASLQSRVLNFLLRVVRVKPLLEQKSIPLDRFFHPRPPAWIAQQCRLSEKTIGDRTVFRMEPLEGPGGKKILYLHGGAYVNSFILPHWQFLVKLVNSANCTAIVPDYPLAPEHKFPAAFEMVLAVYQQLIQQTLADQVILMGDSAGGGLCLALAQKLRDEGIPQPEQLILLSPWLDITMTNPEIQNIERQDPFLSLQGLIESGIAYAGEADPAGPMLSPIYGTFNGLPKISLLIGTLDFLVADARKLQSILASQDIAVNYCEYEDMIHDWMLLDIPEAEDALRQIIGLIDSPFPNPPARPEPVSG